MPIPLNEDIAGLLDEAARLFAEQGANRFRVQAYHRAAPPSGDWPGPVSELFAEQGLAGLEELPGVGESIARSIRESCCTANWPCWIDCAASTIRSRCFVRCQASARRSPGNCMRIWKSNRWKSWKPPRMTAGWNDLAGFGAKRLAGIRDSLAHRLGRVRPMPSGGRPDSG